MNLLPKASASRPRLACEVAVAGVVAGRSLEPGGPLAAVAHAVLPAGAIVPSLKPGNVIDRVAVIAALRRVLESVGGRGNARRSEITLVVPDNAVRVLLLDFDSLPTKLSEALPLVRFRLKKLVPFEPEDAMVSFQIMSTSRAQTRVLAVAIPRDVLAEYESVAREAGFEPGAVLPSTLAALAGIAEADGASLLVNAYEAGVTTAIVRSGMLLLHRSIDLVEHTAPHPANMPAALFEASPVFIEPSLALVDREESAGEWAAQEPLPEHGRNPYADRISTEEAVEDEDALHAEAAAGHDNGGANRYIADMYASAETPVSRFPYASPTTTADLSAELHNSLPYVPLTPESDGAAVESRGPYRAPASQGYPGRDSDDEEPARAVFTLAPDLQAEEIARAISVAVAYFEDQLGAEPPVLLSAGSLGADRLMATLREQGVTPTEGLRVRELVEPSALAAGAETTRFSRGVLAGVVGALTT